MKLSIVIPVYRTEDTLDRCVESVLRQDHPDMEVILVDDGSPDRCPALCDKWATKDQHIRVIHKTNGGLSDARNAGIDMADGGYITFVDSDDYLAEDTYGPLMKRLEQAGDTDILEYPIFVHYGSLKQYLTDFKSEKTYYDMESYWMAGRAYQHTYACNKIFRRSLFDEVRFPIGRVFEDAQTLPLLLQKAHTVQTCNQGLYYYCNNSNGITQTANGQALHMLLQPHVEIIRQIKRQDRDFYTYYLHVLNIQMDVYELTDDPPILPQQHINLDYFNGIQKIKAAALNLLGIKKICKINKTIHKVWRNR